MKIKIDFGLVALLSFVFFGIFIIIVYLITKDVRFTKTCTGILFFSMLGFLSILLARIELREYKNKKKEWLSNEKI